VPESVLVIDDSPEIQELLAVRLRPENLTLHGVTDGDQGLIMATHLQPDLILLDVDMPGMSGFEVCRRLKADPATMDIPVIFLSAATEVYSKVEGFDLGAVDYVTKPFQPAELRARVRAALRTKRYQALLASRAQIDALTSLWNRAYFDRRLAAEVAAVQRYARELTLIIFDLDHFKALNDEFGHPFGDLVLQRVGEVLWSSVRAADAPCRYGGEEFAMVLTETPLGGGREVAARIMDKVAGLELVQKGQVVRVTGSLGIVSSTQFSRPGQVTTERLVRLADEALYQAKRSGRNRICQAQVDQTMGVTAEVTALPAASPPGR
jgi:two-component system, cell cycle response regulator